MIAVNLDRVTVTYVSVPVFENLSWEIHDDRVVGLIGPNGCGKSTLLKLIAGELASDTGFLVRKKGLTVGYLHQDPRLEPGRTVWQETFSASAELARVEMELARVVVQLADPAIYGDGAALARVLDRQARLLDEFERLGGPTYESRLRSTLLHLGFSEVDFDLPVDVLSGGQKKLVGLAKLLVTQPDMLLLDEPDNHLDLDGKAFLEQFIQNYKGAVVIVSHDRYLLDGVVDEIVELEDGRLTRYPDCTYSQYAVEKQLRLLRQQQRYEAQQKEIARIEAAIARFEEWAHRVVNERHIRQARSRKKMLERMDKIEKPILDRRTMGLELNGWRGSNKVLEIVDLDKVFPAANGDGEDIILAGLNLLVWRGERVGLVGPNGAGKSVLCRIILGQEPLDGGECKIGPSVKVGAYAQEHETLDYGRTPIDTVRHAAPMSENAAVSFLGRFLFTYEQARGLVGNLSGGERSRLQLALLMLSDANFLLLDEPTNNLDIRSAEVLEEALAEFEGTLLLISHDRYFLDRVVDRVVELDGGALTEYVGGYSDYREAKAGQRIGT
ncbi:MAG: ABC-F family ATP-binding cassette domain-containing protein [Anaerolineae bacterium]|nr:ABC-F family ATP-binding cassette domain-containing protein [Anaerolineae bacterium]